MMEYTDPWTGCLHHIFPSAGLDTYPVGYFGDSLSGRLEYRTPEQQVEFWQFWIVRRKTLQAEIIKDGDRYHQLERSQEDIAMMEARITYLRSVEGRRAIAVRLLAHRAKYMERLTDRDRRMIENENAVLRVYIKAAEVEGD